MYQSVFKENQCLRDGLATMASVANILGFPAHPEQQAGRTTIADPATLFTSDEVEDEELSGEDSVAVVQDKRSLLEYLARRQVIENKIQCTQCENDMQFCADPGEADGYIWKCATLECNVRCNVRKDSSLEAVQGSLMSLFSVAHALFDYETSARLVPFSRLESAKLLPWIIGTCQSWLNITTLLGTLECHANAVFIDTYMDYSHTPRKLLIAVEETTQLSITMEFESIHEVKEFLDAFCGRNCKIIYKNSSIHSSLLDENSYICIDIEDDSPQSGAAEYRDKYTVAMSGFFDELQSMRVRIGNKLNRGPIEVEFGDACTVMGVQRHFIHPFSPIRRNPFRCLVYQLGFV
eukprot:scpid74344/ scgid6288/ 